MSKLSDRFVELTYSEPDHEDFTIKPGAPTPIIDGDIVAYPRGDDKYSFIVMSYKSATTYVVFYCKTVESYLLRAANFGSDIGIQIELQPPYSAQDIINRIRLEESYEEHMIKDDLGLSYDSEE